MKLTDIDLGNFDSGWSIGEDGFPNCCGMHTVFGFPDDVDFMIDDQGVAALVEVQRALRVLKTPLLAILSEFSQSMMIDAFESLPGIELVKTFKPASKGNYKLRLYFIKA